MSAAPDRIELSVVSYDDEGRMVVRVATCSRAVYADLVGEDEHQWLRQADQHLHAVFDNADECLGCEGLIQAADERITGGGPHCARCVAELERMTARVA